MSLRPDAAARLSLGCGLLLLAGACARKEPPAPPRARFDNPQLGVLLDVPAHWRDGLGGFMHAGAHQLAAYQYEEGRLVFSYLETPEPLQGDMLRQHLDALVKRLDVSQAYRVVAPAGPGPAPAWEGASAIFESLLVPQHPLWIVSACIGDPEHPRVYHLTLMVPSGTYERYRQDFRAALETFRFDHKPAGG